MRRLHSGVRSTSVRVIALGIMSALALAACTAPPPTVQPQPNGRGKVPSVAVAPSAGCTTSGGFSEGRTNVAVPTADGIRRAKVDVPASATGTTPAPVLVSLHPFTADGAAWDQYSGFVAAGTARGYVVITPDGSEPGPRWAVPGGLATGVDDIGFISELLDQVEDGSCIDRNREFAAGFSAGAAMAQALSCTLPWRMAGVAASGGSNLTDTCPSSPGTDVMILHGSADPIAPLSGSTVIFAPPLGLAVDTVVSVDAARAGCDPTPNVEQLFADVRVDRFSGCDDEHRVEYWRLAGAGHTWAGSPNPLLEIFTGPTNTSISATERSLDFFDATA